MSTPTVRKGRRRLVGVLATFAATVGLFLTLGAGSALASVACDYEGDTGVLTVIVSDDNQPVPVSNTFSIVRIASGLALDPDGPGPLAPFFCGDGDGVTLGVNALVTNVDTIIIEPGPFGADGDDTFIKDERSGVFGPGFTTDLFGLNEIEIELELGGGDDTLQIENPQSAGAITIGEADATPNTNFDGATGPAAPFDILVNENAFPADDDADIIDRDDGSTIENIVVNMNSGDDDFTAKGGDGAGRPLNESGGAPGQIDLTVNGGPGDDDLEGSLGDDLLIPGPGEDVVDGNGNNAVEIECFQNDDEGVYEGFAIGGDIVDLSDITGDLVITYAGAGVIIVGGSPDVILGIEHAFGGSGNDTITGDSGPNFLVGGGGNDTIDGMAGDDVVIGDDNGGVDAAGNPTPDGDDNLAGGLGDDCVIGEGGNDVLDENKPLNADGTPAYGVFGNGSDALDGGPGLDDVIDYSARTNRTLVFLGIISWFNDGADPDADSISEECDDVFFTTENARTGSGNDLISAHFSNNQADNEFTAGAGNDTMDGGAGADIFHEGTAPNGSDLMQGGGGGDWADYSGRSGAVNVSLDGAGNDGESGEGDNVGALVNLPGIEGVCQEDHPDFPAQPQSGGDIAAATNIDPEPFFQAEGEDEFSPDVENVDGGSGNDVLTGNASGNTLRGNAGNDQLSGEGGADNLLGGDGDDTISGGGGNDAIDGGAGVDWVEYQSAGAGGVGVQVNLVTGAATGEGTDTLTGLERIGGSSFADTLRGDAGNNIINGRGGNDAIQGNGGDDVVNGGAGNDTVNGNGGNDTVRGQGGSDALRGSAGNDRVEGGPGNDTLFGGRGNDRLFGGAGRDIHRGGPGTDRCRPGAPGLGRGDTAAGCEA